MEKSKIAFNWMTILNIFVGLVFLILALVVIIDQSLATLSVLIILGIALLFVGIIRILVGLYFPEQTRTTKLLRIITGIIIIPVALTIIITANFFDEVVLIVLMTSALALNGLIRIIIGIREKSFPMWFRFLLVAVGLITLALAIVNFVYASYGYFTLIIILSVIFLIGGITRIVYGYVIQNKKPKNVSA